MKHFKSILPRILMLVLVVVVVVGCTQPADTDGGSDTGGTGADSGPVKLVWWGTVHDEAVVGPLIEEFQQINPNITIDYSTSRWDDSAPIRDAANGYRQEIDNSFTSGTDLDIPDILTMDITWLGRYEQYLSGVPSSLYTPESYTSTFIPGITSQTVLVDSESGAQKVLAMPTYADTLGIVYNHDLVTQADSAGTIPARWSEFQDLAEEMTVIGIGSRMEQAGFAAGAGSNVEFGEEMFQLMMIQNGAAIADATGSPVFSSTSAVNAVGAFDFYKSFVEANQPTWSDSTELFNNDSAAFVEQRLASLAVPSWRLRQLLSYNENQQLELDIRAAKIPQLAGQERDYNWLMAHVHTVPVQRPNAATAWAFLTWLSQPEQLRKLSANTQEQLGYFGLMSPRTDMIGEQAGDQYLSVYDDTLDATIGWMQTDGYQNEAIITDVLDKNDFQSTIEDTETLIRNVYQQRNQLLN